MEQGHEALPRSKVYLTGSLLLIDDDKTFCEVVGDALTHRGFVVAVAHRVENRCDDQRHLCYGALDRWQRALYREANGHVRIRTAQAPRAPRDWIEAKLGGANMGDRRLTARLLQMTGLF